MAFKDIALPLAARDVPTTPVLPNSKRAFMADWPTSATTDIQQILEWDAEYPNCNGAAVAIGSLDGYWFLEVDSREVVRRIEAETGQKMPETYRVRSRPGRGHFYWAQTPASIAMGNISQTYVKDGDWSARVDNQYVVAAGSIHPHSKEPYVALGDDPIVPAPDWLVAWCISQKIVKTSANTADDLPKNAQGLIIHGHIHGAMLTQAGKLRAMGLGREAIEVVLLEWVHKFCAPPIDDQLVKNMAASICSFPEGRPTELVMPQPEAVVPPVEEPMELPTFDDVPYPTFPRYVMEGTSLYEHFVKPICDINSRIDYFMWLPAMATLLNYIGPKIRIKGFGGSAPFRGSIYMVLNGQKGKTNKSSSVNDVMAYFSYSECLAHAGRDIKNAEGRTLVWAAGSPEGLGIDMVKTNCKNAILFYDELSQLVSKASIESSQLVSSLLQMYEAGKFSNSIKSAKETYSLDPDTYCTSVIALTTDKKFTELWSRLAGNDNGLDDRFMFILEPSVLPVARLKKFVNTTAGTVETKKLIDKALLQAEFGYEEGGSHPGLVELNNIENRYANRAEKWALALAVDLGLGVIDDECISRAVDIVKYEIAVKNYLRSYEATTREGQIQGDIRRLLEMNHGRMEKREILRKLNLSRHGTTTWGGAWKGLIIHGVIREEGTGKKNNPVMVQLLEKNDPLDE